MRCHTATSVVLERGFPEAEDADGANVDGGPPGDVRTLPDTYDFRGERWKGLRSGVHGALEEHFADFPLECPRLRRAIATRMKETAEDSAAQQKASELRSLKPQLKRKGKGGDTE